MVDDLKISEEKQPNNDVKRNIVCTIPCTNGTEMRSEEKQKKRARCTIKKTNPIMSAWVYERGRNHSLFFNPLFSGACVRERKKKMPVH